MNELSIFNSFAPKGAEVLQQEKIAVIYTRVSHSSQEDNTSLEAQRKRCEEFAKANDYTVTEYFGGTHESAKTDDRKEFNRMLTFVKRNKRVNYILVYSYERFSRTGADGMKIAQDLQKEYKVTTLSVSQGIDPTTITGEFQRNIMLLFGHLDNQMRKDKTVSGMRELVEKGYTPYSIPFGFVNLNKGKAVNQQIVLSEQGKILKKAFYWKAEKQMRNSEISQRLRDLGLNINERRIAEIFANPFYCGIIVSKLLPNKVIVGKHEPMVSKEIFLKVNNIIADNRYHPVSHKPQDENLPLKRFIRCAECDTPFTGFIVQKKNLWYYRCRSKSCGITKGAKQLHEQFKTIIATFEVMEEESELTKIAISEMYKSVFDEVNENQAQYKAKISELKKKLESAEENLVTSVIDRTMFDKYKAKYNQEISQVEKELAKIGNGSANLQKCLDFVIKFCRKPLEWWEKATLGDRMRFQNLLFPNGILYDRKNDIVQTTRVHSLFAPIPQLTSVTRGKKNGDSTKIGVIPIRVTSSGFKPETSTAVMWCSIQLSYEAFCECKDTLLFLFPAIIFKNY